MTKQENDLIKLIDERIALKLPQYLKAQGFTARKLTDNPTDSLQVVNRRTVTLNGTTASRPSAPVYFLSYFDTDLGFTIWFNGSDWVDATGTIV